MKILIAEDDMASRKFLFKLMSGYGECDLTVDGIEAVEAFMLAHNMKQPYDLVCLDIMMPKVDGIKALKAMREIEKQKNIPPENGVKVIIISALNETEVVYGSFNTGSEAYAVKPLNVEKFLEVVERFGLKKQESPNGGQS